MQLLRSSNRLMFAGSWMDERKVDWCTFIKEDGKNITVGLPSEYFVGFRNRYRCDLQLVGRLALEQLDQWPTTEEPYQIEGKTYLGLETVLKNWEFRKVDLNESTSSSTEQAIEGLTRHLNRLHDDEGWEYFYTDRYAPEAYRGKTEGSRFTFRRAKKTAKANRIDS